MNSRLILVEGIPGSGKTTAAQFIHDWLQQHGARPALYLEGDLDHPADFESVACLDEGEYAALLARFPASRDLLERHSLPGLQPQDGERLIAYRKLQSGDGQDLPEELFAALAQHDVYELPSAQYHRLLVARWQAFARRAAQLDQVFVFECCFLQNPLTMYLGRHDEPQVAAEEHILQIAEIVRPLDPLLIYLHPGEAGETLHRVAQVRPQAWLDFVIAYHTQQGHGKAQGWQGFEGMLKFYEMRQAIELELLPRLPWETLLVRHQDWVQDHARIAAYLSAS